MAEIETIRVTLRTGTDGGAESDGGVYLGIAGREFRLARSDIDDYRRGGTDTYVLGKGANVENAATQDPRNINFAAEDVRNFPVYLRFEPNVSSPRGDNWQMREARVVVNGLASPDWRSSLVNSPGIWLGLTHGSIIYLSRWTTN